MGIILSPVPRRNAKLAAAQLEDQLADAQARTKKLENYGFVWLGIGIALGLIGGGLTAFLPAALAAPGLMAAGACEVAGVIGTIFVTRWHRTALMEVNRLKEAIAQRPAPVETGAATAAFPALTPDFEAAISRDMADGTTDAIRVNRPLQFAKKPVQPESAPGAP